MNNGYLRHGPPVAGAVLGPPLLVGRRWASSPDWVKLAEAFGATRHARRRTRTSSMDALQGRRSPTDGPVLVDVRVTARGELLPDDPGRPGRAGHGRLSRWASPAPRKSCTSRTSRRRGGIRTGRKHVLSILVENKPGVLARIAGPVRAARLQHRLAGGGPDRRPDDLAHHADGRRRRAPDRPGHEAAAQAGQRDQDPRPRAGGDGGPRAGAVQDLVPGRRRRARRSCSSRRSSAARSWTSRSAR